MGESTQEVRRGAKRKDPNTPGGGSHGRFSAESATQRAQTRRRLAHLHGKLERLDVHVWSLAQLFSFVLIFKVKKSLIFMEEKSMTVRVAIREEHYTNSLLSSRITHWESQRNNCKSVTLQRYSRVPITRGVRN